MRGLVAGALWLWVGAVLALYLHGIGDVLMPALAVLRP